MIQGCSVRCSRVAGLWHDLNIKVHMLVCMRMYLVHAPVRIALLQRGTARGNVRATSTLILSVRSMHVMPLLHLEPAHFHSKRRHHHTMCIQPIGQQSTWFSPAFTCLLSILAPGCLLRMPHQSWGTGIRPAREAACVHMTSLPHSFSLSWHECMTKRLTCTQKTQIYYQSRGCIADERQE